MFIRRTRQREIGLISITGNITDERAANFLLTLRTIPRVDTDISCLIVRISSNGGALGAAQSIVEGLDILMDELGIPIVMTVSEVATSAAFYVALATPHLVATPGATLGSVGAIVRQLNPEGFLNKLGILYEAVSSGPNKDYLSNFSGLSSQQTNELALVVNDLASQFNDHIAQRRPACSALELLSTGGVYSGAAAHDLRLVTKLGGLFSAIQECERLTGVAGMRICHLDTPMGENSHPFLSSLLSFLHK